MIISNKTIKTWFKEIKIKISIFFEKEKMFKKVKNEFFFILFKSYKKLII